MENRLYSQNRFRDMSETESTISVASESTTSQRPPDVTILPRKGWQPVDLGELWRFRHLLWLFSLRDVTVRYKQTVLGGLWALIQPLLQVVVFTLFFGKLMGLEERLGEYEGRAVPYAVFVLTGQIVWGYFASLVNASANSMLGNANILRKIYLPRLIIPLSAGGAPTVDTLIGFGLLLIVMLYYAQPFTPLLILAPLALLMTMIVAQAVGIMLSALIVKYRDFRFVVPFMIQLWFYVTPVIYPKHIVPEKYQMLLYLNPMAGVVDVFRALVLGGTLNLNELMVSVGITVVMLVIAVFYFARTERRFADIS
jgi:lipopolysaccharide transport system permease protein